MTLTSEDMLAISRLLDVKTKSALQSELQPVKDEIRDMRVEMGIMKNDLQTQIDSVRNDLQTQIDGVRNDLQIVKGDLQTQIDSTRNSLRSEIDRLSNNVHAINLKLENEIGRSINLLAENYMPAAKRYEKESAELEAMKVDIEIMKGVIENHSEMLQKLA